MKRVVIVVPTYNEKENITPLVKEILAQQKNLPEFDLHVLVSDSHSPDGTLSEVQKSFGDNEKVHTLDVKEMGLGLGLVKGFNLARDRLMADYLAQIDADFSAPPSLIPKLLKLLESENDIAIGSRLMKGSINRVPLYRKIFTYCANILASIILRQFSVTGWTLSFRAFSVKLYNKIDLNKIPWRAKTFVFQPSFLYEAIKKGAKVKQIPVVFEDRRAGRTKMQVTKYIFELMRFLLKEGYRRNEIAVKFLVVGTFGFSLNTILLYLFYDTPVLFFLSPKQTSWGLFGFSHPDLRLLTSTIIAVECSIVSNFLWHENWTFRKRQKLGHMLTRYWQFNATAIGSPIITVATVNVLTPYFGIHYLISNAIGVLLGLSWNYILNTRIIWRSKPALST